MAEQAAPQASFSRYALACEHVGLCEKNTRDSGSSRVVELGKLMKLRRWFTLTNGNKHEKIATALPAETAAEVRYLS